MMPKNIVWVLGWRLKHPYLCTPWARNSVFRNLGLGCLKWTMPKNIVWVLWWSPKHPYLCTRWARKKVFGYLGWGCLKWTMRKNCLGSGVAPQTPIPLHTMGQKRCFSIPGMGLFELDIAKKYCLGSVGAPQTPIPLHTIGQKRCFLDTWDGGV